MDATETVLGSLPKGEISAGTTIIAVAYDGGVVLGADSRTSMGPYIANRVSDKITPLHDYIYVCRSGSAADTQAVSGIVRTNMYALSTDKGSLPTVNNAAQVARQICYKHKDQLMAGLIIAGWDPINGGSVYSIPLGGACVKQNFAIGGSGSTFIYGWVDDNYREGMSKEECAKFVQKAVAHAMARDGSSGGVIRTVSIDRNGVERDYIAGDKLPFNLY